MLGLILKKAHLLPCRKHRLSLEMNLRWPSIQAWTQEIHDFLQLRKIEDFIAFESAA